MVAMVEADQALRMALAAARHSIRAADSVRVQVARVRDLAVVVVIVAVITVVVAPWCRAWWPVP
jgi:hypothetical protein